MQGNDEIFPLKNFIDFFMQFPWAKDDDGASRHPPVRAGETSEASESIPPLPFLSFLWELHEEAHP
jgi:hypothetical protein